HLRLRRPVPVDRRLPDAGPGGDAVDRQPAEADFSEQGDGRLEDRRLRPAAAPLGGDGIGGRAHAAEGSDGFDGSGDSDAATATGASADGAAASEALPWEAAW